MIVIDTSVLVAALAPKDKNHVRAQRLIAEIDDGVWGQPILPDWVFVEVLNFVRSRSGRAEALRVARKLSAPSAARLVACSPLFEAALALFTSRVGEHLSFADAGIVAVAQKAGAVNIATYDAGFRSVTGLHVIEGPRAGT